MVQEEEPRRAAVKESAAGLARGPLVSRRVTDHLANERTFLAWVRTGVAIIALGFVVERFGLLLRELGVKIAAADLPSPHLSPIIGVALIILGAVIIVMALFNFLRVRREIDQEQFHPSAAFSIVLTILTGCAGAVLAVYLLLTA